MPSENALRAGTAPSGAPTLSHVSGQRHEKWHPDGAGDQAVRATALGCLANCQANPWSNSPNYTLAVYAGIASLAAAVARGLLAIYYSDSKPLRARWLAMIAVLLFVAIAFMLMLISSIGP